MMIYVRQGLWKRQRESELAFYARSVQIKAGTEMSVQCTQIMNWMTGQREYWSVFVAGIRSLFRHIEAHREKSIDVDFGVRQKIEFAEHLAQIAIGSMFQAGKQMLPKPARAGW
ncbi:hypothetical protein HED55_25315 [Ochrobactrum haematophilum]|uniref:Uncharacterized protein n=1 Tax=Brucella haematophila TaxID=419474 RepID=A0ABX1DQQ1_9HYPH|nr:hypothetical protein [Brucella haematophila]